MFLTVSIPVIPWKASKNSFHFSFSDSKPWIAVAIEAAAINDGSYEENSNSEKICFSINI